jgi:hypothetical protein|tara:strand:- start:483 stop:989 length:507 start_codon:yes stop_codon:yes gene_type:complete
MKKKHYYFVIFLLLLKTGYSQEILFDEFYFDMGISEAKKILKSSQKKLTNVALGKGTIYAVRKRSLVAEENKLISLNLWSKKNLTIKEAEKYLVISRAFFENKKYKTVYAQENWSNPLLVKKNLPCIRLVDPERTIVVEFDPRGQGNFYNIFVTYYNYDWFLRKARGQ